MLSIISIGGGIHGVSTAYYLSQRGVKSLIIEKSSIASAASGSDIIVVDDVVDDCYDFMIILMKVNHINSQYSI
jgi:flavin-dependent dehydrogenase